MAVLPDRVLLRREVALTGLVALVVAIGLLTGWLVSRHNDRTYQPVQPLVVTTAGSAGR